ncbi:hypothetical protein ACFQ0T_34775 [Kitasatospora gansuensis]
MSEAVHALQALASHLPELLDRLGTVLSSEQASGRLTSVSSDISEMDLVRIARDTRDQLGEAGRIAGVLGETLTLAETSLAGIGKPWGWPRSVRTTSRSTTTGRRRGLAGRPVRSAARMPRAAEEGVAFADRRVDVVTPSAGCGLCCAERPRPRRGKCWP